LWRVSPFLEESGVISEFHLVLGNSLLIGLLDEFVFALPLKFSIIFIFCAGYSRMRLPAIKFSGRIMYSRTFDSVQKAAAELLQALDEKNREIVQFPFGFDIEWKPSFHKGCFSIFSCFSITADYGNSDFLLVLSLITIVALSNIIKMHLKE